jgi:hypothetical protein
MRVWPIRRSRFGGLQGRQASRGGDSPQGFPLEASEAPVARAELPGTVASTAQRKQSGVADGRQDASAQGARRP